jgi:hypothetical protein
MPDVVETSSDVVTDTTHGLCGVCNDIFVEPDETSLSTDVWNYRFSKVEISKRVSNDNELLEIIYGHKRCAIQCDECNRYFLGSRWGGWRTHNQPQVKMEYIHSRMYCPGCTTIWQEENPDYTSCSECNQMYCDADEMNWSELHQDSRCNDCYNNEIECDECGSCFYEEDSHTCDSYNRNYSEYVKSYSYKPEARFWGTGTYYLGFELEVEDTDDNYAEGAELAFRTMNPNANRKYRGYLKGDGSLVNGFEIVSHPHTLEEYQKSFPWAMLTELKKLRFRSWNTSTCGLHVHVSRTAFDDDDHQIRFIKLIYDNQRQVQRIAGRSSNYASFSDAGKIIPKVKYKSQSNGRYAAVNVEPENTLEVRVFKGSLHIPRVLSGLEFVQSVVEYTRELKIIPKDKPFSWVKYVSYISSNTDKYPSLFETINRSFNTDTPNESRED